MKVFIMPPPQRDASNIRGSLCVPTALDTVLNMEEVLVTPDFYQDFYAYGEVCVNQEYLK